MLFHLLWRMGAFLCQHEASKIKNTIVRNSFSAVVQCIYSLQHYVQHRKSHCCAFCQLRKLFRWFYMKALHWLCTTEIIPPFAQNGTSYSAVVLYKVKRRHCYCTPCSVCKRETFVQFNISLNYVYNKNTKKCSFKSSEHIRKKVDGPYFEVSANKISRLNTIFGERGGSVVECRTPEREVGGS